MAGSTEGGPGSTRRGTARKMARPSLLMTVAVEEADGGPGILIGAPKPPNYWPGCRDHHRPAPKVARFAPGGRLKGSAEARSVPSEATPTLPANPPDYRRCSCRSANRDH